MIWELSHRADADVVPIADRHYNRQKIGAPQFVPPGRCVVLKHLILNRTPHRPTVRTVDAFWVTSWPFAEYVKHRWPGAWICSAFRNESVFLSSALIRDAIMATRAVFGEPPKLGMVTFVDASKVKHKRDPGRCFRKAGFQPCGQTEGGLVALQLLPEAMPKADPPVGLALSLFV